MKLIFTITTFIICIMGMIACGPRNPEKVAYTGEDISGKYAVIRNKFDKRVSFKSTTGEPWVLYAGNSVDGINIKRKFMKGEGVITVPLDLGASQRWYFVVADKEGTAILAERKLPMNGGYNFRDLGGYRTKDGFHVKWGKVLRSDELHNLTKADLQYLTAIPVTTLIDFRSPEEIAQSPDNVPASVKNNIRLSISPGNLSDAMGALESMTYAMADDMMRSMYIQMVTDSACIVQFRKFFKILSDEDNHPVLYHCTAGKDRTGMASALLLTALGVDREKVTEDYLLSNKFIDAKFSDWKGKFPGLEPLFGVKREYIDSAFDTIRSRYGTVDNFIRGELGADSRKLKELFLYGDL